MLSFFKSEKKPVYFMTKDFGEELSKKSILVLSPEFYWTKKANLNVKYVFDAAKMAPSIFDGILPAGNYKYKVFKLDKNEFIFIAFDIKHILYDLEHIGIDLKMVEKIYTAQSELLNKDVFLKVNDKYAIVSDKGVITYIPLKLLNTEAQIDAKGVLKDKKLSSNYIYSKSFQKLHVSSKETNLILWFLMVLVSVLLINTLKIQKERNFLTEEKNSLIQKYHIPTTSFQIKSMQKELSSIDLKQNTLKENIKYLGKFKLSKEEFFDLLSYENSKLKFVIKFSNNKREEKFKKYIAKKLKILKTGKIKAGYLVEVSL